MNKLSILWCAFGLVALAHAGEAVQYKVVELGGRPAIRAFRRPRWWLFCSEPSGASALQARLLLKGDRLHIEPKK